MFCIGMTSTILGMFASRTFYPEEQNQLMQKAEYGKKKSTVQINSNDKRCKDKVKRRTDRCYTNDINNTGRVG